MIAGASVYCVRWNSARALGSVGGSVRKVAVHGVGLNVLRKSLNRFSKAATPKAWVLLGSGSQNIQQEPKAGDERDGRERQNCELMARQADQFNTTGSLEGARRGC